MKKTKRRCPVSSRLTTARLTVFAGMVVGAAYAVDLPFYKEGSETTNRTPESVAVSSSGATLDSRTVMTSGSAAITFDSDEAKGLMIIVR